MEAAARNSFKTLSDEMKKIAEALQAAQQEANNILAVLQGDVYKNEDRKARRSDGSILYISSEDKHIDKWNTIYWGQTAAQHEGYTNYVKEHKEK